MKKKKIALIFIFVLSFSIVGALAVTQATCAEALTLNLNHCVYDYQTSYCAGPYENTYNYTWEEHPIITKNEYNYWIKKVYTTLDISGVSYIKLDAMCRIGKSSNKDEYKYARNVIVSNMVTTYKCEVSCSRLWSGNKYTAHFTKTVDPDAVINTTNDYRENEWEDFDAASYDYGFKGRWVYGN